MEPDVIRMYSSSPPPMEDGAEEDDNEFGDFGTFAGVPSSISFTEFDTPTTFNQTQALTATSPPELLGHRGFNGTRNPGNQPPKANGVAPPKERTEAKKVLRGSSPERAPAGEPGADCNGGGTEVLTNGFAAFDSQGSPAPPGSGHSHLRGVSTEDAGAAPPAGGGDGDGVSPDDFADFAAFSTADGHLSPTTHEATPTEGAGPLDSEGATSQDTNGTESDPRSVPADGNTDQDAATDSPQRDAAFGSAAVNGAAAAAVGVADGDDSEEAASCCENDLSPGDGETETDTSLGRPLSTDALEEYGDGSTTGSAPSPPPLQEETATPADHSQLAEDDEDFGDFGDAGGQGFADFDQLDVQQEQSTPCGSAPLPDAANARDDEDDFGDFNSPKFHSEGKEGGGGGGRFADFPLSQSFGDFSSAADGGGGGEEADAGWSAFGEQPEQPEGESWAAFSTEHSAAPPTGSTQEEEEQEEVQQEEVQQEEEEWHESGPPEVGEDGRQSALLASRLVKLFQTSFPQSAVPPVEDEVPSLSVLLAPQEEEGAEPRGEEAARSPCSRRVRGGGGVWSQLRDVHEALGLRYQWGGSHGNKVLLCCLGIDTRNILFTGQKKQPVIVPMYAASLGMLEPTKEPVKPVSAAEMIASIAQAPPESSSCPSDPVQQEALPPVQFDWSSSGLTNPLDASGGSSLLNLDFFGPVEDSGSTSSPSIPGVDPELYELTTAKLDPGGAGSRVADAFARLMSTMEKTSTSTRKPRKDENLSEEAAKVIAALPDLSFMQAKVLMFPATLTPLGSQATVD